MTNGKYLINKIIENRAQIANMKDELIKLESNLSGMEIEYKDNYAVIEGLDIDGEVILYVEEDDGNSYNVMMSVYELLEII